MATELLSSIADIIMGQSPAGETCNESAQGLPLLNGPTEFGAHHPTPVQFTTDPRKKAKLGDILFCVRGSTTGRMNWADREYAIGRGIAAIRHKNGIEYQHFLRGIIDFRLPELLAQATGSTFPNVSYNQVANLSYRAIDKDEQLAIAKVLGALDDKIELNRQMNEILEALAQSLFKSWFVDTTASGLPKGWHEMPLPEAMEINPSRPLRKGNVAPYLDMANMPTRSARALEVFDREFGSGMRFVNGDTLVARITPCLENGKTCFVDFLDVGKIGWGSTEYIVLRPKPPLPPEYAYFLARTEDFRSFAVSNMTGSSGRQRVPADCFDHYKISVPPTALAEKFGQFARNVLAKMKAHDDESRTLSALRGALLPKLLSGELSVPQTNPPQEKQAEFNIVPLPVQTLKKTTRKTTDEFVEAIVISQFTRRLCSTKIKLLGRKRYNKLSYLAHRKAEDDVTEHYLKKAAGPYSPWAKYEGPEKIALKNGYIKNAKDGDYVGFAPGENATSIDSYLHYPICAAVDWAVAKFQFRSNDDLELLATVDYAALDLIGRKKPMSFEEIKNVIATNKEWASKLKREIFSDANIKRALTELRAVFPRTYAT